ncbi:hypothetical protein ACIPXV_03075 [Streptomyces libani]|uniref:hypothetical protein n=1 Tax=Streptomyces nigrescens TaxID=1920 RepID=UPI003830F05B
MTISPAVSAALRVINAAWAEGPSYDLASQAVFALESAGRLKSPEAGAEDRWNAAAVQRVRDLVAYWSDVEGGEQAAEAIESVLLNTHRPLPTAAEWAWGGGQPPTTEVERLRARVAELEQQITGVRAVHTKYSDSEHCQHDGQQWPCPTRQAAEVAPDEYPPALPWARLMDAEDRADFLDELAASAITHADSKTALSEVEDTCARWRAIAEAQHAHNTAPGPDPQEPEHPAPCRWPASPTCTCTGPVPYALTPQASQALARPSVDKLRGILAPSSKAGA